MADEKAVASGEPSQFYTTLIITFAIGLIVFLIFLWLRKRNNYFFYRKCYITNQGADPCAPDLNRSTTTFGWIPYTLRYDSEKYIFPNYGGLDMVMYIKFLKYSFFLFAAMTVLSCAILLPVYITGENSDRASDDPNYVRGMNMLTFSNLAKKSNRMWAPWILTFVFSIFFWIFMFKFYQKSVQMSNLERQKESVGIRTNLATQLPSTIQTNSELKNAFYKLYRKNNVAHGVMAPLSPELREYQNERKTFAIKLRIAKDVLKEKGERPTHRPKILPCTASVDSIDFYQGEISRLDNLILEEQKRCKEGTTADVFNDTLKSDNAKKSKKSKSKDGKPTKYRSTNSRAGFVTFQFVPVAMAASQTLHRTNPDLMKVRRAPEPEDVYWEHLHVGSTARGIRTCISIALITLLFLFWTIPVTFISSISNLDTLSKVDGLSFLVDIVNLNSFVSGIIQGLLPALALIIFMSLLPLILRSLHRIAAPLSKTDLDRQVLKTYWSFLYFNVFLVVLISGTAFSKMNEMIENPTNLPTYMAQGIPSRTTFFINYIMVAITGHLLFLSRLIPYIVSRILKKLAPTHEEKIKKDIPSPFSIVEKYSGELLIFSLGIAYCTLGPLVNVFAMIYFAFAYLSVKYNFMHSYTPNLESIRFSRIVIKMVFAIVLIYQALMIGVFSLNSFPAGVAIVACLLITILLYMYLEHRYARTYEMGAVMEAPLYAKPPAYLSKIKRAYMDPIMKNPDDYIEHVEIVNEGAAPIPTEARSTIPYKTIDSEKIPEEGVIHDDMSSSASSSEYASDHMEEYQDSDASDIELGTIKQQPVIPVDK